MLVLNGLDDVLDGKLELDCPSMTWSQGAESLSGAGYIRQATGGGFEFALFSATRGDHASWFEQEVAAARVPAGTLLPRDSGGELRAIDVTGQEWTAEGLRPQRTVSQHQSLRGTARELRTSETAPEGAGCVVEVRIAGRVRFPGNVPSHVETSVGGQVVGWSIGPAVADVQLEGAKLQARELSGGTSFMLLSDRPLRMDAELRLLDAVTFLENSVVPWSSLSRWQDGRAQFRVRGERYVPSPRFALPPLPERDRDSGAFWRLVASLVGRSADTESQLRVWIVVAATAATWPLESRGLVTAVAVEAVAKLLLPGYVPDLAGYSTADEEQARKLIASADLPERLASRLLGVLKRQGASASDRLFELARLGVVDPQEVDAWKALRNSIAHGALPPMGQELVDKVHRVRTLFSRLVLSVVGYEGPYVDYGCTGWPVRDHSSSALKARE